MAAPVCLLALASCTNSQHQVYYMFSLSRHFLPMLTAQRIHTTPMQPLPSFISTALRQFTVVTVVPCNPVHS
uniref:Putative secreted peptide n=1 Tax=Anopheles braziliensis TaxID=58242 RepID=A0A2M3ZS74_9DIPT